MSMKKSLSFLPGLLLVGLLAWLSGCGTNVGTRTVPANKPDSVSILVDLPTGRPAVTLTIASMVQQLYATMYALPQMPDYQACTQERGPHYTLTSARATKCW